MHHELKWKINPRKMETNQALGPTPIPVLLECLWRGGAVQDIPNSQSLWLAPLPEPQIQVHPTLENGKTGRQRAGSAYWYCAGLDGIFTCWNQQNSGKTGSCECRHRDERDQTPGGGAGIPLQGLLPPRIRPERHHRAGAKETQGAVGAGSDERKRGIGSGIPGIGSGIPEKSSAGGGKGPRASLEVAVALALDGFLDAQQHRGEPLIQPRDGVEFLHLAPAKTRIRERPGKVRRRERGGDGRGEWQKKTKQGERGKNARGKWGKTRERKNRGKEKQGKVKTSERKKGGKEKWGKGG